MKRKKDAGTYVDRRLEELGRRYELDDEAIRRLRRLLELLAEDVAPTTVHEPERGVDVHISDSLTGLDVPALREAGIITDLGSGAGLPALVLAVALPGARIFAVESVAKKGTFIRRAAEELRVNNLDVVAERAESWQTGMGTSDVVCARALAALPVLLEYAAPLLRVGGTVVAWKGRVTEEEEADGAAAAAVLGLERREVMAVEPFTGAEHRRLYVYSKVMETSESFPRRPGIATKRPLSAKK